MTQNIYCGLADYPEMAYVLHCTHAEDLFIDVGANLGAYTILACGVKKCKGYCFEPVPETYDKLVDNLRINSLLDDDQVKPFCVGVADKPGVMLFSTDKNTENSFVAQSNPSRNTIEVEVTSLDTVLHGQSPTIIKVDVEGFETLVINGARQILGSGSVHSLIIELYGLGEQYGFDEDALIATLQGYGYNMVNYLPVERTLVPIKGKHPRGNVIFCRDLDLINSRLRTAPKISILSQSI